MDKPNGKFKTMDERVSELEEIASSQANTINLLRDEMSAMFEMIDGVLESKSGSDRAAKGAIKAHRAATQRSDLAEARLALG